ncbi:hypothetical protein WMF27_04240 [Sorangium sp. So ce281]
MRPGRARVQVGCSLRSSVARLPGGQVFGSTGERDEAARAALRRAPNLRAPGGSVLGAGAAAGG